MPETLNGKQVFSLQEVALSIKETLANKFTYSFWIKAELNKLNFYRHSGHCYPELVEKSGGKVIAQMRSNLWRDDYARINQSFLNTLNEPLKDGIKILFLAKIEFHPEYGLALHILDIDPGFTLGDLEKEKREAIKKLQSEGIYNKNRLLTLPMLPQRIAIISVETSKGYADFMEVLDHAKRSWGYAFFQMLFPSLLQGDKAVPSILKQLNRIKKVIRHFDAVAIIRGGGGDIGLSCYNNYELAKTIALFPIPVITGIGHATNETVSEMVAFENAITPTRLAEFIIQKFHNFSVPVKQAEEKLISISKRMISDERTKLRAEVKLFRSITENVLLKNKNALKDHVRALYQQSNFIFKSEKENISVSRSQLLKSATAVCRVEQQQLTQLVRSIKKEGNTRLKNSTLTLAQQIKQIRLNVKTTLARWHTEMTALEKNLENISPAKVLKRGYSITRVNGKAITHGHQALPGNILHTTLYEGEVSSTVNSKQNTP